MIYDILMTQEVSQDLEDIYLYIGKHFLSPQAAEHTLKNIQLCISKLAQIPDLGMMYLID